MYRCVFIAALLLLSQCRYYSINENRVLKSRGKFENFFQVSKINVQKYSEDGVPTVYSCDTTVMCFTKDNPDFLDTVNIDDFKKKNPKFRIHEKEFQPQSKVFFDKSNEYYYWVFYKPGNDFISYDICPMKFRKYCTYLIHGLYYHGNYLYCIFISVDSHGSYKTIHYTKDINQYHLR